MQRMVFSCFPKLVWCRCFRFTCCVRPPGERQTFLQVGRGHGQRCIEMGVGVGEGDRGVGFVRVCEGQIYIT